MMYLGQDRRARLRGALVLLAPPQHPYTLALLSAAPSVRADPTRRASRAARRPAEPDRPPRVLPVQRALLSREPDVCSHERAAAWAPARLPDQHVACFHPGPLTGVEIDAVGARTTSFSEKGARALVTQTVFLDEMTDPEVAAYLERGRPGPAAGAHRRDGAARSAWAARDRRDHPARGLPTCGAGAGRPGRPAARIRDLRRPQGLQGPGLPPAQHLPGHGRGPHRLVPRRRGSAGSSSSTGTTRTSQPSTWPRFESRRPLGAGHPRLRDVLLGRAAARGGGSLPEPPARACTPTSARHQP